MSIKIDFHTHILPKTWPNLKEKYGYEGWIGMKHNEEGKAFMIKDDGAVFRPVNSNVWSAEDRLKDMKKSGVNIQVLSTVPVMFSYWAKPNDTNDLCLMLNQHIASAVNDNPKHFIGLGTVPMQSPQLAVEQIQKCKYDFNMKGIMIGSHINQYNLCDKQFDVVWKACEDMRMPVFVHPWGMEQTGRMANYWLPWLVGMPAETTTAILAMIFGGVFERFPQLKVCFAHGAGMFPYVHGRAEHCFNVYPKDMQIDNPFPPSKYLGRIYADSLVHTNESLNLAVKVLGEDSLFLGSDYPFLLGEHIPGSMIDNSIKNNQIKDKIFNQNVCKFLDIELKDYL